MLAIEVDVDRDARAVPVEDHGSLHVVDSVGRREARVVEETTEARLDLLMPCARLHPHDDASAP
jgi:hypothetical protein